MGADKEKVFFFWEVFPKYILALKRHINGFASSDSLAPIKSVFVHLIYKVDIQVANFNVLGQTIEQVEEDQQKKV